MSTSNPTGESPAATKTPLDFLAAGGEELRLVPCLNDHEAWVAALAELCRQAPMEL